MNMKTKLLATALLSTLMFSAAYAAEHEVKMLNNGTDGTISLNSWCHHCQGVNSINAIAAFLGMVKSHLH